MPNTKLSDLKQRGTMQDDGRLALTIYGTETYHFEIVTVSTEAIYKPLKNTLAKRNGEKLIASASIIVDNETNDVLAVYVPEYKPLKPTSKTLLESVPLNAEKGSKKLATKAFFTRSTRSTPYFKETATKDINHTVAFIAHKDMMVGGEQEDMMVGGEQVKKGEIYFRGLRSAHGKKGNDISQEPIKDALERTEILKERYAQPDRPFKPWLIYGYKQPGFKGNTPEERIVEKTKLHSLTFAAKLARHIGKNKAPISFGVTNLELKQPERKPGEKYTLFGDTVMRPMTKDLAKTVEQAYAEILPEYYAQDRANILDEDQQKNPDKSIFETASINVNYSTKWHKDDGNVNLIAPLLCYRSHDNASAERTPLVFPNWRLKSGEGIAIKLQNSDLLLANTKTHVHGVPMLSWPEIKASTRVTMVFYKSIKKAGAPKKDRAATLKTPNPQPVETNIYRGKKAGRFAKKHAF